MNYYTVFDISFFNILTMAPFKNDTIKAKIKQMTG